MSIKTAQHEDENQAGPSSLEWHTVDIRIPFHSPSHALIAKKALQVDRESNSTFTFRDIHTDSQDLIASFRASTVRLLRLSTNSFMSSLELVVRTLGEFAVDETIPEMTDDELREDARRANEEGGSVRGIELRGDGKGAGSGQEVK